MEKIVLGAGCFWCIEAALSEINGIQSVVSGYAGGEKANPSYADICTGKTGHAEVVEVVFDAETLPLESLLGVFFKLHDPTQLNRQGNDVGTQYRSVIFCETDRQKQVATQVIKQLSEADIWPAAIVTQVEGPTVFYPAEAYHQGFYQQNPTNRYCQWVVRPKLEQFLSDHAELLKG